MEDQYPTINNSSWMSDNMTNSSSLNTTTSNLYTYGERIFVATTWTVIALSGMTGNSMVVIAVLLSRKLRTATNAFVVNLAVADFLTSLFLTWSVVALLGKDGWPIPRAEWLCTAGGFMIILCTGVSLYNLAAISLIRFLLITKPLDTYRKIYTPINIFVMVALMWIIPVALFISLPLAGIGGFGYDAQHYTCSDLDQHPRNDTFQLIQTVLFYPIPLVTIVLCYTLIFRHIKRHFRQQRIRQQMQELSNTAAFSSSNVSSHVTKITHVSEVSDVENTTARLNAASASTAERSQRIDEMEVKITKNLFLVMCAFVLFFSPYGIALFIPDSDYLLLYFGIGVLINSTVNPLIYSRRHPHFKVVFGCMLRCRYGEIPEPSDTLKRLRSTNG